MRLMPPPRVRSTTAPATARVRTSPAWSCRSPSAGGSAAIEPSSAFDAPLGEAGSDTSGPTGRARRLCRSDRRGRARRSAAPRRSPVRWTPGSPRVQGLDRRAPARAAPPPPSGDGRRGGRRSRASTAGAAMDLRAQAASSPGTATLPDPYRPGCPKAALRGARSSRRPPPPRVVARSEHRASPRGWRARSSGEPVGLSRVPATRTSELGVRSLGAGRRQGAAREATRPSIRGAPLRAAVVTRRSVTA
jgi:hypothetical protein